MHGWSKEKCFAKGWRIVILYLLRANISSLSRGESQITRFLGNGMGLLHTCSAQRVTRTVVPRLFAQHHSSDAIEPRPACACCGFGPPTGRKWANKREQNGD